MPTPFIEDRRKFFAQDREDMRSKLSKPVQKPRGRIVGHSSVTGPIYGHDGFVISHEQEPLGHADIERECLEKWGYHVQMIPPQGPMDDPKGTPNVTLQYADNTERAAVERSLFRVGRTVNLIDVLHLLGKTLAEYCSEPSEDRWKQIEDVMTQLQAEYQRNGLKFVEYIEDRANDGINGLEATDTALADRLMSALEKKCESITSEIEVDYIPDFSDVALEIDAVLQYGQSK